MNPSEREKMENEGASGLCYPRYSEEYDITAKFIFLVVYAYLRRMTRDIVGGNSVRPKIEAYLV